MLYQWLKGNKELINVATSRAREQLVLVADSAQVERLHGAEGDDDLYELVRIKNKYDRDTIRQISLGSQVVCHDTDLLYQEATEAYKNVEHVVQALVEHGLCHVIATLRPLITYKG